MPVTITGQKYTGSLTSVGTTTITNSGASFSSGDFAVRRLVGLWSSGGTYKGLSFVRRWISSTQVELTYQFVSPTGATVTQVSGDVYRISKNYAESVTTGIAVSGNVVTISDRITFGTASDSSSVCFYDEDKQIVITSAATSGTTEPFFRMAGGITVHGYLSNFADRSVSNGCSIVNQNNTSSPPNGTGGIACSSTSAKAAFFGGSITAQQTPCYIGEWFNGSYVPQSTAGEFQFYWGISTNCDLLQSSRASLANLQQAVNVNSVSTGSLSINLRWANCYIEGGSFSLLGSAPLSVFGADNAGTYNIGAPPGRYLVVSDCGFGARPALWRSSGTPTQTINFTNLITPNSKLGWDNTAPNYNPGTDPNNNATAPFRFSGTFSGLLSGSLAIIKNNNIASTISDAATVSGTTQTLTVLQRTSVGHTVTVNESAWQWAFLLYGYQILSGSVATETVDLGPAGNAPKVRFGDPVAQVLDGNISQAVAATVAAYTVLTTFDRVYDYAQYFKALNTTNAVIPTLNQQLIASSSGTLNTPVAYNVVIDSAAGSVFAVNTGTTTITLKPTTAIASGTKNDTLQISSGRTLTFAQNGDKSSGKYIAGSGTTVIVASGETNLRGSTLTGCTINVSSGSATVLVDSVSGLTAGSNVTLQAPIISFTASVLTSATFNNVRCRLSLVIGGPVVVDPSTSARASGGVNFLTTDVNITTNRITISGIAGKINANTVIRFYGSDLPVPLDSRAVYYPVMASLSGNAVSVSGTVGGVAIDLIDVGSGTDMFADVWTELDNSLITSGSYVVDLGAAATAKSITLVNGDALTLQAIHWRGNPSSQVPATASEYLEKTYLYNGASLSTLETLTLAPYHNQFCVIRGKDGSQVTDFILDASTPGKIQLDSNATAISSYDAAIFFYYVQSTQAGMRLLRGNLQILGLNSILLTGQITLDAANRAVLTGPFTKRADGQSLVAVESNQIDMQWSDTLGVAIATEVPIDLPQNIVEAITATLAKVSMLSSSGGGGGATAADIWAYSTRTLTAGTNISLAKGTGITGLNDITAADVWAAGTRSLTDKTGFSLSQTFPVNFANLAITGGGAVTVGTLPTAPTDWISAVSVSAAAVTKIQAGLSTYSGGDTAGTTTLLSRLTSTRAGNLDNLDATVSSRLATGGYTTPPTVAQIWGTATSGLTTVGTIGKLLADNINAPIGSIPTNPLLTNDGRLANLDAAISSRSTYAGADTAGTTTLLSRVTSTRAGNLDNLDATISSRSTYSGGDTAGTTTLLSRLTTTRAGYLDNLNYTYVAPDNATIGQIGTRTLRVDNLITNPGGGDRFTATALINAPTGGGGSSITVADIWAYSGGRTITGLTNNAITAASIQDGALTTAKFGSGAIVTPQMIANALNSVAPNDTTVDGSVMSNLDTITSLVAAI